MLLRIACLLTFLYGHYTLVAQNAYGALHSNYTPTNSLYINPSSILDAKVWIDINIAGGGTYVNNDFVFLRNQRLSSVVRDLIKEESRLTEDDIGYDQSRKKYHAYNRTFVAAPSVVWSQGDHAVGLSIGGRSFTDARRLPDFVARFIENGVPEYTPQHDINYSVDNVRTGSVHFGEIKLTYAHTFLKRRREMFMGGITVSKIFSVMGAGANVYDFDFLVDDDSLSNVIYLKTDAMFTPEPEIYANGGWGFDFGFTYQKMLGEASSYYPNSPKLGCRELPYKYKIGISLMDVGNVKFRSSNVLYAGYEFTEYDWYNYANEEVNEDNPTDLFELQEPDIDNGVVRNPTKIGLPTFLSAQFDYNVWASRIYVNATVVQGFEPRRNKFGVRHASTISITPRFESFFFDFAIPISLYEYQHPQLGASVRLGPLTVGTDKLFNWILTKDIYGADIYVYLKLPFRYHPKCDGKYKSTKFINGEKHKRYRPCDAYN